jgi:DNA helicase-2/ATP-dependent DNA helicase PcrA
VPASPGAITPEDRPTTSRDRAANHRGGPLLVLGSAGSGRTQTLIDRFAGLVAGGTAPEEILLLTRTAAAAEALRARVEDALGDRPFEELPVLPIHGMCARLLRDEALEAGIDPFAVTASPADRLALLLDRVDELTLRRHDLRGRPASVLGAVITRIDGLKEAGIRPRRFSEWAASLPQDGERGEREREFAGLFEAHDRLLLGQGLLDFGELVLRTQELLEQRPHVRARVASRWRHVLVDDLEDATPAQVRVIGLLAADHGDLVATADDDQAIDEPRGAADRLRALLQAPIGGRQVEVVRLERSLRCPERVVVAAEAVVAPIADRLESGLTEPAHPADVVGSGADGDVRLWRCASERAQAQGVAAAIERLVREGVAPGRIGVLVRSVRSEGQELAVALEERALPFRLAGAAAFFGQAEVRDVLAWLRLLVNPSDAGAVVRALARPPIELHSVDLARCIQIAKRRKLDMVSGLVAATESPQLPPEARERVLAFLKLHRDAAAVLDTTRPDLFVHRLIERLGLRRAQVFAAQADVVERLVSLAHVGELAASYVRRAPQATPREFARWFAAVAEAGGIGDAEDEDGTPPRDDAVAVLPMHAAKGLEFDHVFICGLQSSRMPGARRVLIEPIPVELLEGSSDGAGASDSREEHVAEMRRVLHVGMTRAREGLVLSYAAQSERGAPQHPSPFAEEARAALGAEWEDLEEQLFGPDEALHAAIGQLRDELLSDVQQIGARLGELRLDTDLDVAHGVTRYLELLKLAALHARPEGQDVGDALPGINAAILHAATAQQREVLQTSSLDDVLMDGERDAGVRAKATAARHEPSLAPFLPRRGEGLALSASDIETYRACPLKYKFARVFRVPQEPTINQRFGIVVHQVLERYHQSGGRSVDELLGLLEAGWRRSGFGPTDEERQLHAKAENALKKYHERFQADDAEPMWFEKSFNFKIGAHTLRGRVDRVDRMADGRYELIDYKTGRPKAPAQLRDDVQLALYAVAATQAWNLDASVQSYLYVLDDQKVPLPDDANDAEWIAETVREVADGILGQGFEPTPSYAACSICDYRIACPAAER